MKENKTEYKHIPVMLSEVLEYLDPKPGESFIDCTLGGGGYTRAIAEKVGESGLVLAIDEDELAINNFKNKYGALKNVILAQDNFRNLAKITQQYAKNHGKFRGIALDLGLSSAQLEDRQRGFSFQSQGNLDMGFGQKRAGAETTEFILNNWEERELARIFREYGEEKFARKIAEKIVLARNKKRIATTQELVEIIKQAIPKRFHFGKIHPATRVFQALRIATNDELESLKLALPQMINLLNKGGKIVVVSYHSLEDRIVKNFFKQVSAECGCPAEIPVCQCAQKARLKILTKKPIIPTQEEIERNPRSRSAKMRVAEVI